MNIYWYVSREKVESLKHNAQAFLSGIGAELSFKFPLLEGKLSGSGSASLFKDLERLEARLRKDEDIRSFDEIIPPIAPTIFSFKGIAARQVEHGALWVAIKGKRNALLLAGSSLNVVGRPPAGESSRISPSADPVGAFRTAFKKDVQNASAISFSLSYVWQELAQELLESSGGMPRVEGLAIFARSIDAHPGQFGRIGMQGLKRIVIGSPLFVRQV